MATQPGAFFSTYASGTDLSFLVGNVTPGKGPSYLFDQVFRSENDTSDYIVGTSKDDIFYTQSGDVAFGGKGYDVVVQSEAGDGSQSNLILTESVEAGILTGDADAFVIGNKLNNNLIGNDGDNLLSGEDGRDVLLGGLGNDTLFGGEGNDVGVGESGNDIFVMEAGNDYAYGGDGHDYFYMGEGNDVMFGGAGVDVMLGEAGADYLDGGEGVNYYFGGAGPDTFVVTDVASIQVIQDWASEDVILLQGTALKNFDQVIANSYQNGAYFVVNVDADTAFWINGATAQTLNAGDFAFA